MKLSIEELEDVVANAKTSLEQYLALELIALKAERVPVAFTGSGSLAAIKVGHDGYIWGTSAEAHPIKLYTTPQPAHTEQVNSPETPDGWVMVPKEPTEHMIVCGFESEPDKYFSDKDEWKAYKEMSGCQQAAHRAKLCWNAMLAAAPKPEK